LTREDPDAAEQPGHRRSDGEKEATMNPHVHSHVTPSALILEILIEELRAELANCLNRKERRQIEAELAAAHAELAVLRRA